MKKTKIGALIALLVLTVAFASVTTTLVLTGTLSIGSDSSSFEADVVFTDSVTMIGGEYSLSNGNKTLEFKTGQLNMLESEAVLSFEVRNNSRQYDASATIDCSTIDPIFEDYVSVEINPISSFTLDALETESGTIKVKLIRSITGSAAEIPFECTIVAEALERDSLQTDPSRFVANTDMDTVGSEICLEDECFNVINSTDTTVSMIANYNLNKDNYRQSTLASGVQYDEKVEEIISNYLVYLQDLTRVKDTTSIQATLLTRNDLLNYGCVLNSEDETPAISCIDSANSSWLITNQEYYLLAGENDSSYESVDMNGFVVSSNNGGVRPVITVSKTLIKQLD